MKGRSNNSDGESPPKNPDVFDDEYALDPDEDDFMPAVSDGFRPTGASSNERQHHDRGDLSRPLSTSLNPTESDLRRVASRNSTMKLPHARDGASNDLQKHIRHSRGPSSQTIAALQHRVSISSTGSFAPTSLSESPLGAGPSHPYNMYPQTTVARTPSVTTSSTQRQPHRSISLQRPTHPYGMYTQNTVDDENPVPPLQSAIPVGFPGNATRYHRQIGPDGEEQDIIGPDGHTEQLPPYSRYPESSARRQSQDDTSKAAQVAEAVVAPVQVPVAPPNPSADAVSSPASTVPPTVDLPQPPSLAHSRDPLPAAPPQVPPQVSPPISSVMAASERGSSEKQSDTGYQPWRSRKLWGKIPMSVALVLLILVLLFAIVLGAAIGTFAARSRGKSGNGGSRHNRPQEDPSPQVTGPLPSLFDATPIPTPVSLPQLPIGNYALPLGVAQESSPACLVTADQLPAWSCKMTFAPLVFTIQRSSSSNPSNPPAAMVRGLTKPDGGIQYGVQAPNLPDMDMQLVVDTDYQAYGPAYHFSARYDKLVVLNSDELTAGASSSTPDAQPNFRHRFQVQPGDEPWFCYWNGTYIEGYVYVMDNSTAASFSSFPTGWPSNPYDSSVPVDSLGPSTVFTTASSTVSGGTPTPTRARRRRGDGDYPRLSPYPRIVKIEERRLPESTPAYCQKMRLYDTGIVLPVTDNNEQPIIIALQENDPSFDAFLQADAAPSSSPSSSASSNITTKRSRSVEKRTEPLGACHCQWMFQ